MADHLTILPSGSRGLRVNVHCYASTAVMCRAIARKFPCFRGKLWDTGALTTAYHPGRRSCVVDVFLPSLDPPMSTLVHEFVHVPDMILEEFPPPPCPRVDKDEFRAYWASGILGLYLAWTAAGRVPSRISADAREAAVSSIDHAYLPRTKTKFPD